MAEALQEWMHFNAGLCRMCREIRRFFGGIAFGRGNVRERIVFVDVFEIELELVHLSFREHVREPLHCFGGRHLAAGDVLLHAAILERRPIADDHAGQDGSVRCDLRQGGEGISQARDVPGGERHAGGIDHERVALIAELVERRIVDFCRSLKFCGRIGQHKGEDGAFRRIKKGQQDSAGGVETGGSPLPQIACGAATFGYDALASGEIK